MIKLLTYIFLWIFVTNGNRIKRAMEILFNDDVPEAKPKVEVAETKVRVRKPKQVITTPSPINNKRDEVIDAINFLRAKKSKTKEDRDKIQMLEVILKSV